MGAVNTQFNVRKTQILGELKSPLPDLSPKGGPDVQILPLLELINAHPELVSTSSCAGRVAVYAEGAHDNEEQRVRVGGKGGGGKWLYVSHDEPGEVTSWNDLLGQFGVETGKPFTEIAANKQYVHFKFEPMILHVLCANSDIAFKLLGIALACGFRESGFNGSILAVRCSLRIDAPIGYISCSGESMVSMVDLSYVRELMKMAKERFLENKRRTNRFFEGVEKSFEMKIVETKDERRIRKRAEGLKRQTELVKMHETVTDVNAIEGTQT
ncbi:methyltransferase TYW3-domain-containing protein [Lipomyces arxii]|uniref:methyltransferase TYW3-domain-containing protein n=1 Tax=Lipomyces arxii TaxID=56418 RepID=UPI0034CE2BCB